SMLPKVGLEPALKTAVLLSKGTPLPKLPVVETPPDTTAAPPGPAPSPAGRMAAGPPGGGGGAGRRGAPGRGGPAPSGPVALRVDTCRSRRGRLARAAQATLNRAATRQDVPEATSSTTAPSAIR